MIVDFLLQVPLSVFLHIFSGTKSILGFNLFEIQFDMNFRQSKIQIGFKKLWFCDIFSQVKGSIIQLPAVRTKTTFDQLISSLSSLLSWRVLKNLARGCLRKLTVELRQCRQQS